MQGLVQLELDQVLASNRQLDSFAATASHDLLEPMRKITAYTEMLERRAAEELSGQNRELVERIRTSSGRMSGLVEDLLKYARVRGQKVPFERVELRPVVQEVLCDLELRLERTGALVEIGALPAVKAHRFQMRELFQNLIANALKFADPSRSPRVEVLVRPGAPEGFAEISVADNGIGFEPEDSERIFAPFARLHPRGDYEGSGVGLAVCRAIAERHGGGIRAESEPGKGSVFFVLLPLADAAKEEAS
jgi:signal transduction histidine kinase